jgi:O-antigen/teichoic acid export membrane protein
MDTLTLALFRPQAIVGLFSLAARPLQPLQLLPRIIVSVLFPTLARTAHTDRAAFSRMFQQTTQLLWSAALPISIFVSMAAAPLIVKTAGYSFAGAVGPLQILIWSTGLIFINAQLRFVLTALDAEQKYWRLIGCVLATKIVLQAGLIATFGLYGAAWGSLIGEAILCFGGLYVLRTLDVAGPNWLHVLRVAPAAAAMSAVLWPFTSQDASLPSLALAGVGAGIVYVIACLATGVWPWSDVLRIWASLRSQITRRGALELAAAETDASPG